MEGILEFQRRTHEVVDHLELAIVEALMDQPRTHKARLMQEHYVSRLLDNIQECSQRLERFYLDERGLRENELARITINPGQETGDFYDQLKTIKDRHRRLESTIEDIVETEALKGAAALSEEALDSLFSGEEAFGRFLDLHEAYDQFINLKEVKKIDYLKYLGEVDNFATVPVSTKQGPQYQKYLATLLEYLESFFRRSKPLYNCEEIAQKQLEMFEESWKGAKAHGWEEMVGREREDLFCKPCAKQFFNEAVFKSHLTGKKHLKALEATSNGIAEACTGNHVSGKNWAKETALKESIIAAYLGVLGKVREDTRTNVECKQSRSSTERAEDIELEDQAVVEQIQEADTEQENEGAKIYNPLNLPLDWDGKPIPYWLWKLHGLGVRYPCEICGNHVYMGRKAFDQHFFEWRHSHGLKCLGIPNTRHFFQVTSIKDAEALWNRLKQEAKTSHFRPEVMEEFEDQHGNVYNRKTFEDLKRQGLI